MTLPQLALKLSVMDAAPPHAVDHSTHRELLATPTMAAEPSASTSPGFAVDDLAHAAGRADTEVGAGTTGGSNDGADLRRRIGGGMSQIPPEPAETRDAKYNYSSPQPYAVSSVTITGDGRATECGGGAVADSAGASALQPRHAAFARQASTNFPLGSGRPGASGEGELAAAAGDELGTRGGYTATNMQKPLEVVENVEDKDERDLRLAMEEEARYYSLVGETAAATAAGESRDVAAPARPGDNHLLPVAADVSASVSYLPPVELQLSEAGNSGLARGMVDSGGAGKQDADDDLARVLEQSRLEAERHASQAAGDGGGDEMARAMEESRREQERTDMEEQLEFQRVRKYWREHVYVALYADSGCAWYSNGDGVYTLRCASIRVVLW